MPARAGRVLAGVALSALLAAAYARGAWPLGFVLLVPWLVALDGIRTLRGALLAAIAMAAAFVAAAFGWFAPAIADYTGLPTMAAMAVLLVAAPLLQPQFIAFVLVRHIAARRHGPWARTLLAVAAWLAVEWVVPRVFGDTLGHGLQPARLLRQGADLAGAGGLTLVLLAVNEAIARTIAQRSASVRALARPLGFALGLPLLLAGYGVLRLAGLQAEVPGKPLRIGLVQAAIVDYERLRRENGAYAVVRRVLDAHYALSMRLRERQVDALVWPETVYPTTFGQPRSGAGAELDRELAAFVAHAGVPLVFGTYERDAEGEYNVAAFVDPVRGPLGAYRKTRLFPLTEYVPTAIDGARLRRWLPWAGTWRPGDGARVFPLFTADGREVPVAPLICRDDVDPGLARDGVRLGAQVLVGLSNDAWFSRAPLGARLHLAAAAFRSVETRLPQVRATTNGISAVIDASGDVTARTAMGERTALIAEVSPREPRPTLFVRWGNWLGPASLLVLFVGAVAAARHLRHGSRAVATMGGSAADWTRRRHRVLLLRPWQRVVIGGLRAWARVAVLVLGAAVLSGDEPPRMLAQLRDFALWVVAPELLAAALALACSARLSVEPGRLVLVAARRRVEIERAMLATLRPWRWPWPSPGFDPVLQPGRRWTHGIAMRDAATALCALAPVPPRGREAPRAIADGHVRHPRQAWVLAALGIAPWRIDHPAVKFALFALVPALPAFRLHQLIAYGGAFGEYHAFGAAAYFGALLIWWASWVVALVLVAGGLRVLVEAGAALTLAVRPQRTPAVRRALLGAARAFYFLGVPAWLLLRLVWG